MKSKPQKGPRKQQALVDDWNAKYPVGTKVIASTPTGKIPTATRSEAQLLAGHTAVVWLERFSACRSLESVKPEPEVPATK